MSKRIFALTLMAGLTVAGIGQAPASAKPNFAGTWKLNLQKSDMGQMAPNSETDVVTQTDSEIKVTIASDSQMGNMNYSYAAKLDGRETLVASDAMPADSPFKIISSKAEWQGALLIITQTTSFQDSKGTLVSTYSLSEDGKVLTKTTHVKFDMGEFDSKAIYDKN